MLYRENKPSFGRAVQRLFAHFDGRVRRRRRVEQDLLALSPYLQRDIGFPETRLPRVRGR
ncbi:MAG: hypothetical protein EON57_16475 [Alphaproteobacteria bacterium]|nr:MAG: hypothetical protein EON57_16475 [Alphaproteobacteria bacterium]